MKFFDLHCDTAFECCCNMGGKGIADGAYHLSLDRAPQFDAWHQVYAIFMPDELRGADALNHYRRVRDYIKTQERALPGRFHICRSGDELELYSRPGVCGGIMSVEGGSAAAGSLDAIEEMYNDGVRMMTLTWNAENELGSGVKAEPDCGLSDFGRQAVALMNRLDMIVDVSHLSDRGFFDVAEISSKPFVASHSNSRRLCSHPRNLTDEMFSVISGRGGLVGINFSRGFLQRDENAAADDILRHTEHFLALGGEHTVCMGSDFDGTDMPDGITGIESIEALYERFLRANYPESLVDSIFYGNACCFMEKALNHGF